MSCHVECVAIIACYWQLGHKNLECRFQSPEAFLCLCMTAQVRSTPYSLQGSHHEFLNPSYLAGDKANDTLALPTRMLENLLAG